MQYRIQEKYAGAGMRIGLLGGSFDPPHAGHRHISEIAFKRLRLDSVWWLVTPQNPLKIRAPSASAAQRLADAQSLARHPRFNVTDVERRLGTRTTIDTIGGLTARYPRIRFLWIMGADNFIQLPHWAHWTRIMTTLPVAVIARPGYHLRAGLSKAACRYQACRLPTEQAILLPTMRPPAWTLLNDRLHPASSTQMRAKSAR